MAGGLRLGLCINSGRRGCTGSNQQLVPWVGPLLVHSMLAQPGWHAGFHARPGHWNHRGRRGSSAVWGSGSGYCRPKVVGPSSVAVRLNQPLVARCRCSWRCHRGLHPSCYSTAYMCLHSLGQTNTGHFHAPPRAVQQSDRREPRCAPRAAACRGVVGCLLATGYAEAVTLQWHGFPAGAKVERGACSSVGTARGRGHNRWNQGGGRGAARHCRAS